MKRCLTLLGLLGLIFLLPTLSRAEEDPEVVITASKRYKTKKILLFPLELPSYVFKLTAFPLAATGRFMERNKVVERTIDLLSNEEKTFWVYPIIEIGAGSGFGGGVGVTHSDFLHRGYHLKSQFIFFTDQDLRATASFKNPKAFQIAGRPVAYTVSSGFTKESDEDFFGVGNTSLRSNFSEFAFDDVQGGLVFDYSFWDHWSLSPSVHYDASKTKTSGGASPPSAEALFPAAALAGFDRWIRHLGLGLSLAHDTRDARAQPESGGLRRFSFYRFQGVGQGGFDFNEYELDLRQFFRLGKPRRVLVLRNAWAFQQETGTSLVPFYRLRTLDLHSPLRGFDRGRFRDHGGVIFNAEYRYPVWDLIDGSIFFDTGRVFDDPDDFAFKNFKYSIGGGIRIVTRNFLLLRIQAAYGGEGVNLVFTASSAL